MTRSIPATPARALSVAVLLGATLAAQVTITVPAHRAATEGNSMRRAIGTEEPMFQQLLVDPMHLQAMAGRTIDGLSLRRDTGSDGRAFAGGACFLRVWLSTAPVAAEAPSAVFAANRGPDRTLVFEDFVDFPASPPVVQPPVGSPPPAPFDVAVPFRTPFLYGAGTTLLVEFEAVPRTGSVWWPFDAEGSTVEGSVTEVGTACGPLSQGGTVPTAHIGPRELVPGRRADFLYRGERPGNLALFVVTAASAPQQVDLSALAPGCAMHLIAPALATEFTLTGPSPGRRFGAPARVRWPLPADPAFFGLAFSVQWLEFGVHGFAASNALDVQVANAMPGLGLALVEATRDPATGGWPAEGRIDNTTGLVVRFEHSAP